MTLSLALIATHIQIRRLPTGAQLAQKHPTLSANYRRFDGNRSFDERD